MVLVPLNHRHADAGAALRARGLGREGALHRPRHRRPAGLRRAGRRSRRTATRRCSPARIPRDFPDDVAEDDLAGLFYTGGTTGRRQGRDAPPSQPRRERDARPGRAGRSTPRRASCIVAPMFHARGLARRARHRLARRPPGRHAGLRPRRRCSTSSSASGSPRTLVVPTHARRDHRGAARPPARRVVAALPRRSAARRVATETLRRAHRAFPDAELIDDVRRDRDRPARHGGAPRGAAPRLTAGALVRAAAGRRRGADRRPGRPHAGARAARSARWRSAGRT